MLTKDDVRSIVNEVYESVPGNVIPPELAIDESVAGLKIFDVPSVGFGSADDPLFDKYKDPGVIGPWFMGPREWFPEGQTVVSIFFPFTEEIRAGNRAQTDGPSFGWLHGRIEGQKWILAFGRALKERLDSAGVKVCSPYNDPRWFEIWGGRGGEGYEGVNEKTFGSNWSERHAAYVCGLGTFGLSKGIITGRGMAGRFISIIIPDKLEPDVREYDDVYGWCVMCGACAGRCPAGAISLETGKDHNLCRDFLEKVRSVYSPRYGCGLCQTGVPCESCAPGAKS